MDLRQWGTSKINDAGVPTKTEQSEGLASDSLWIVHFQLDPYYLQLVAITAILMNFSTGHMLQSVMDRTHLWCAVPRIRKGPV